jgi:GNAT superfamily N-acetyltransferase
MLYTKDYSKAHIVNGQKIHIRAIRKSDDHSLVEGFAKASKIDRFKRFLSYKKDLTEKEVHYLTTPDFIHHFAFGIEEVHFDEKIPFGVARFIINDEDSSSAECAIILLEKYHGKGLGSLLFKVLVDCAKENNVVTLYGESLSSNTTVNHLLSKFGKLKTRHSEGICYLDLEI